RGITREHAEEQRVDHLIVRERKRFHQQAGRRAFRIYAAHHEVIVHQIERLRDRSIRPPLLIVAVSSQERIQKLRDLTGCASVRATASPSSPDPMLRSDTSERYSSSAQSCREFLPTRAAVQVSARTDSP